MCYYNTSNPDEFLLIFTVQFSTFQAQSLGLLPGGRGRGRGALSTRGSHAAGTSRGRGRGFQRGRRNSRPTTLDKRPRVLTISGFKEEDKDEVLMHFSVSDEFKLTLR